MKRINLLFIALLILISSSVYAGTTNKYYEIDFTYTNIINNKPYTEEATLLRDKAWLEQNNITKAGDTLILNIPEFGVVNVKATARSVELSSANPEEVYSNNQSMVTGTFKHYSVDVREYTLQDTKTGITQTIEATPNHAFYVQNRTAYNKYLNQQSHFIEIQYITTEDKLINEQGNNVQLVCINSVCSKQLVNNNKPLAVYNLEIFKQHQYLIVTNKLTNENRMAFNNAVLVHNIYGDNEAGTTTNEISENTILSFDSENPNLYNINNELISGKNIADYDYTPANDRQELYQRVLNIGPSDMDNINFSESCRLRSTCLLLEQKGLSNKQFVSDWKKNPPSKTRDTRILSNLRKKSGLKYRDKIHPKNEQLTFTSMKNTIEGNNLYNGYNFEVANSSESMGHAFSIVRDASGLYSTSDIIYSSYDINVILALQNRWLSRMFQGEGLYIYAIRFY